MRDCTLARFYRAVVTMQSGRRRRPWRRQAAVVNEGHSAVNLTPVLLGLAFAQGRRGEGGSRTSFTNRRNNLSLRTPFPCLSAPSRARLAHASRHFLAFKRYYSKSGRGGEWGSSSHIPVPECSCRPCCHRFLCFFLVFFSPCPPVQPAQAAGSIRVILGAGPSAWRCAALCAGAGALYR